MQEINQLNPEQTSSPMTSTRTPEYVWRQSRTAFKDNLGFSPISSQRKVDMFRKKVMAVKKGDWDFIKTNRFCGRLKLVCPLSSLDLSVRNIS